MRLLCKVSNIEKEHHQIVVQGVQYWERASFDDFGKVETNVLHQIREKFEDQLDCYVELVDMTDFDL
jgi:hypothetical protein